MELHIWGPAFGLPSIDPDCLAALVYVQQIVPAGRWKLIANHDPSFSPTDDFPALRDGSVCVGGFEAIVDHLARRPSEQYSLDTVLDPEQAADCIAFKAHLQASALPLLDLSLYASIENYYHATGPAYTALLPWHVNYFIPPGRRAAARARTQHLGIAGADFDQTQEESPRIHGISAAYEKVKNAAGLGDVAAAPSRTHKTGPQRLQLGLRRSVTQTVKDASYSARFRLDALATSCFAPLQEQLGDKRFLVTRDRPSSVDCLVFGFLALALFPRLPNGWLSNTFETKFPQLANYVRGMKVLFLGDDGSDERTPAGDTRLPWSAAKPPNFYDTTTQLASDIVGSIPWIGDAFGLQKHSYILDTHEQSVDSSGKRISQPSALGASSSLTWPAASLTACAVAGLGYVAFSMQSQEYDHVFHAERPTRNGYGEAGAALAFLSNRMRLDAATQPLHEERLQGAPVVEVEADIDIARKS